MEGKTALGASSPAKPALHIPDPLSHTRAVTSSSHILISLINERGRKQMKSSRTGSPTDDDWNDGRRRMRTNGCERGHEGWTDGRGVRFNFRSVDEFIETLRVGGAWACRRAGRGRAGSRAGGQTGKTTRGEGGGAGRENIGLHFRVEPAFTIADTRRRRKKLGEGRRRVQPTEEDAAEQKARWYMHSSRRLRTRKPQLRRPSHSLQVSN